MKKLLILIAFIFIFTIVFPTFSFSQGMMGQFRNSNTQNATDSSTAKEEAEGKEIFDKLQAKQISCNDFKEDEFELLGEYFMGLRLGSSHENMNNMMKQMIGETGERQMHITLGERQSGCDTSYPFPTQGSKFLPIMGMKNGLNIQAGWNSSSGFSGSLIWILIVIFLILGIIYFWKEIHRRK